ncbi:bifunctional 4-hydroxy-2-oxoglutarate aldolase/2-dehydro-3-deoxy-phosphogluconate aldolase [Ruminococcaceae bacterium OttesenSCG-928-D13]|nr:bifunctional 4-hydroxy-2-oxoglutarate aldolase/2-dehydro-3-deoxy-phosphogluconate aldolase [Ruminococcaceae bacterium OttesenSCG-928-D13]
MNPVLEKLEKIGIVPVIAISDVEKAVPLAKALLAGGIPCAEVTFRTAEGEQAIARIAREVPDILVGAGTVLTTEQVDRAIAAGAQFVVSPGFNPTVVDYCIQKGMPITPGCATPSEMEMAMERGLEVVKFFPAEQAGGLAYLKAVAGPYPRLRFMPTGGVNAENLNEYLAFEKVIACGGSWMVKKELIEAGCFEEISALCRGAVQRMLGLELAHLGINMASAPQAAQTAKCFEDLFGFAAREGNSSWFAGRGIEVMKTPYLGEKGHIAIGTSSVLRAQYHLERSGVAFDESTAKTNAAGRKTAIYLRNEVAGFALHLVQK